MFDQTTPSGSCCCCISSNSRILINHWAFQNVYDFAFCKSHNWNYMACSTQFFNLLICIHILESYVYWDEIVHAFLLLNSICCVKICLFKDLPSQHILDNSTVECFWSSVNIHKKMWKISRSVTCLIPSVGYARNCQFVFQETVPSSPRIGNSLLHHLLAKIRIYSFWWEKTDIWLLL